MPDAHLEAVLRRAQEDLICPVCEREFELLELKVRGVYEKQYLVQASCHRGHSPTLILYVVGSASKAGKAGSTVTTDHVLDLHQQLRAFNGDFRTLFKQLDDQTRK